MSGKASKLRVRGCFDMMTENKVTLTSEVKIIRKKKPTKNQEDKPEPSNQSS